MHKIRIISDIDKLIKLRFDYIATEIELKAKDKAEFEENLREFFSRYTGDDKFTAYAMEIDGVIVSAAFLIIDEKPPGLNNTTGRYGTIMNVITYPEYRKMGYATAVMEFLIRDAIAKSVPILDLYSTNAGKRLYEKIGFKEIEYLAMRYFTQ